MLRSAFTGPSRLVCWLVDLVLPPRCLGCGATVSAPGTFCAPCWGSLRFLETGEGCACCGEPADAATTAFEGWRCGPCMADPPPFTQARAAFIYGGAIRRAILAFKHRDRAELAALLAGHMARAAPAWLADGEVMLVPVPLHRWRLWRRGYNQAALLARALARQTGCNWQPEMLERVRMTRTQQGLSRAERLRNLRGAIRVARGRQEWLRGRLVVLVDDVLTTGATARCCAAALLQAGAREVRVLTLARVAAGATQSGPDGGVAARLAAIHIDGVTVLEGVARGKR